jgi:hypothetical protein
MADLLFGILGVWAGAARHRKLRALDNTRNPYPVDTVRFANLARLIRVMRRNMDFVRGNFPTLRALDDD